MVSRTSPALLCLKRRAWAATTCELFLLAMFLQLAHMFLFDSCFYHLQAEEGGSLVCYCKFRTSRKNIDIEELLLPFSQQVVLLKLKSNFSWKDKSFQVGLVQKVLLFCICDFV